MYLGHVNLDCRCSSQWAPSYRAQSPAERLGLKHVCGVGYYIYDVESRVLDELIQKGSVNKGRKKLQY